MLYICHFICHTLNIHLQITKLFLRKISLRVWAATFERKSPSCRTWLFSLFSAEPLYQNVRIDQRIIFTFWSTSEKPCQKTSRILFFLVFSDFLDFSVYLNYLSKISFWGWGTTAPPPGPHGGGGGGGPRR